jgi:serine phosphatase RsbU (regulator of sigma subunit)/anti-sigma regulatory factor (Ser/Thr protein kinase)
MPHRPEDDAARSGEPFVRGLAGMRGRLLGGSLVIVIALTGLALTLAWQQYTDGKQQALNELRSRAILAGSVFDTYFAGQIATLNAIAASPAVTSRDIPTMERYLARAQPAGGTTFTGGIGWLDLEGVSRASSNPRTRENIDLSDRSYFKAVVASGKPYISEAIVTRLRDRRVIVMAVPTRDSRGRVAGVLAGALLLQPSRTDQRAIDLGYAGLQIIDREGQQLTLASLAHPVNGALVSRISKDKEGVLADTDGLDGSSNRVVAYATSKAPGWKTIIDQPTSVVFASAHRSLVLAVTLIAATALAALAVIGWAATRAKRELRAEQAQIGQWAEMSRSLSAALDAPTVCELLASSLTEAFPHAFVAVSLADLSGDAKDDVCAFSSGRAAPFSDLTTSDAEHVARLVAATVPTTTRSGDMRVDVGELPSFVGRRGRSLYGLTLSADAGERLGTVALLFASAHGLDATEQTVVRAYADQVVQALVRVGVHEHEHDAAILLQRSLLPDRLPEGEGLRLAACYQAAGSYEEVGGDWYDAVRRPDGLVHLSVGDVAGKGLTAAVLMGQLRTAFHAYALDHRSPAAIVERMSRHVGDSQMATTVCATFDPVARELVYASAGHPPPLLIDVNSGNVAQLDQGGRPPLGWSYASATASRVLDIPAHGLLALYTDGLIEHRGSTLDAGIASLAAALVHRRELTPQQTADDAVASIVEHGSDDDSALLLVEIGDVPTQVSIEIPARAELLAELRRRVGIWLTLRGLNESRRDETVLALSEACNNAIEHGYRETEGTIRIRLRHDRKVLQVVVDDDGTWQPAHTDPMRGHGLLIMKDVMDRADVTHTRSGTRVALERLL